MGRDLVLKSVRTKAIKYFVGGIIGASLSAVIFVLLMLADMMSMVFWIVVLIIFALSIAAVIGGAIVIASPESTPSLKKIPFLLDNADRHFSSIKFQDDLILISDGYFSKKKEPITVSPLSEVLWIYIKKTSYNGIPTAKVIIVRTAFREISISISMKKAEVYEKTIMALASVCPNARVGYSMENLDYANNMSNEIKSRYLK